MGKILNKLELHKPIYVRWSVIRNEKRKYYDRVCFAKTEEGALAETKKHIQLSKDPTFEMAVIREEDLN